MKRIIILLSLLFVAVSASAQQFSGLRVDSYSLGSLWPSGFSSIKGTVNLTVTNTGELRTISAVSATAYRNGNPFIHGTCDNVTFLKGTNNYSISGEVTLANDVSMWSAFSGAWSFDAAEYTMDVYLTLTHENGKTEKIFKRRIPVSRFLK